MWGADGGLSGREDACGPGAANPRSYRRDVLLGQHDGQPRAALQAHAVSGLTAVILCAGKGERLRPLTHSAPMCLPLNQAGLLVVVVTNQSGIARGLYSEEAFWALARRMDRDLANIGARIDAWYFCPHHPDFTGPCDCRKPSPGMLKRAIAELRINPTRSFMIGDADTDGVAACAAGIRFFLFRGGDLRRP